MALQQAKSDFQYDIALGAATFTLRFKWNTRFAYWTVDIQSEDGTYLVTGRKLLLNVALYDQLAVDGLPTPALAAIDTTATLSRIERLNLGNEVGFYAIQP